MSGQCKRLNYTYLSQWNLFDALSAKKTAKFSSNYDFKLRLVTIPQRSGNKIK